MAARGKGAFGGGIERLSPRLVRDISPIKRGITGLISVTRAFEVATFTVPDYLAAIYLVVMDE